VTSEEMIGGQVLRMYEVRDLIRPISDFPAREINVSPSGDVPEIEEDLEEREALVITEDSLDTLIRDNVAPESWEADPFNSLSISAGTMVVNQTPEVHEQIQKLLDDLREATGIMVDIESRFLTVEDNFLEDIGIDFRGLGAPGLGSNTFFNDYGDPTTQAELGQEIGQDTDSGAFYDDGKHGDVRARVENLYDSFLGHEDVLTGAGGLSFQWTYLNDLQVEMVLRAVSKSERVELVTAPRVLVFNTARSNLTVMNQVAYVKDFDVEIAQGSSIADPIIGVIEDGVVLDVRPVVSADRRFITLELRPTVAQLQRPMETFVTTLGVSGNSVTLHLPEVEISRVRTSVPMPDGGTVLLGGFKIHHQQDLRSGVPILNKIPLVSFLFERKGTSISNRKLLILLTANIVIPEEHEPSPAQLGQFASLAPR
jgi:general secretion pathway protein D